MKIGKYLLIGFAVLIAIGVILSLLGPLGVLGIVAAVYGALSLYSISKEAVETNQLDPALSGNPFAPKAIAAESVLIKSKYEKYLVPSKMYALIILGIGVVFIITGFAITASLAANENKLSDSSAIAPADGTSNFVEDNSEIEAAAAAEAAAAQAAADQAAADEAARIEAERVAQEAARIEAERVAQEAAAQQAANEAAAAQAAADQAARDQAARDAAARAAAPVENPNLPYKAICDDGTTSFQDNAAGQDYRGMCSGHGGIAQKLGRVA